MASFPQVAFDFTRVYTALGPSPSAAAVGVGGQAPKLGQVYEDLETGNVYRFVKNTHSAAQVAGYSGFYDISGGLTTSVIKCATANLNVFAGIWMGAAPAAGYGWLQVWGYYSSVLVEGTTDVVIGDSLKGVNAQFYLVKDQAIGTAATYQNAHVIALAGFTTNSTGSIAGFIRAW